MWLWQKVQEMSLSKLNKQWVRVRLPKRPKDAHKGTFGRVLVIAGSKNYPGAAYLTCAAAYRVGAGLVSLATEDIVKIIVSKKLPEVTFLSFNEVYKKLSNYDVLLLGPGLGQKNETIKFVEQLLINKLPKTVIDGDGLNILSRMGKWWGKVNGQIVLTHHPGEMARLTGLSVNQIQSDREDIAIKFAQKWNQIIVLKGANTVVVSPAGEMAISPFANPALATAGTGDILAGVIGGLLAQGLTPFDAACVGVYIHGLTGEMLKEKYGESGGLASDLLPLLARALLNISK